MKIIIQKEVMTMGEITYTKVGDYYVPDIIAPEQPDLSNLGKFGRLRRKYLKNEKPVIYQSMFISGELPNHLLEIDRQAMERLDLLMSQMAKKQGVNEELKAADQMKWVGLMNNIRNSAEEIILRELIYN